MPAGDVDMELFGEDRPAWAMALCGVRRPREGEAEEPQSQKSQKSRGANNENGGGGRGKQQVRQSSFVAGQNSRPVRQSLFIAGHLPAQKMESGCPSCRYTRCSRCRPLQFAYEKLEKEHSIDANDFKQYVVSHHNLSATYADHMRGALQSEGACTPKRVAWMKRVHETYFVPFAERFKRGRRTARSSGERALPKKRRSCSRRPSGRPAVRSSGGRLGKTAKKWTLKGARANAAVKLSHGIRSGQSSESPESSESSEPSEQPANLKAKEILKLVSTRGRKIAHNEMESVLKLMPWSGKITKNTSRKNVLPEGGFVRCMTLGLVEMHGHKFRTSASTEKFPDVAKMLGRWMEDHTRGKFRDPFPCTSVTINYNFPSKLHRDEGNEGPSMVIALGSFTGGRLRYYAGDVGGVRGRKMLPGPRSKFADLSVRESFTLFDGNRAHQVTPYSGHRFSVVFYTRKGFVIGPTTSDLVSQLKDFRMNPSTGTDIEYYKSLLFKTGSCVEDARLQAGETR